MRWEGCAPPPFFLLSLSRLELSGPIVYELFFEKNVRNLCSPTEFTAHTIDFTNVTTLCSQLRWKRPFLKRIVSDKSLILARTERESSFWTTYRTEST